MVSAVVESDKKVLSSLEKEEVFIANTTRLAKLVFDIQHEQKVTETYPLEGSKYNHSEAFKLISGNGRLRCERCRFITAESRAD